MSDVIATERIFEEVPIPRTDRTRRVLRFGVGQTVPEADAKRLAVSAAGAQKKVPLAELDESGAVVPLTQAGSIARTSEPVTSGSAKKATTAKKAAPKKAAAAKKSGARR